LRHSRLETEPVYGDEFLARCFEPLFPAAKNPTASVFKRGMARNGYIHEREASELSKVVDGYARSLQTIEFEERLSKLEKAIVK
jgi:hypothetical protein